MRPLSRVDDHWLGRAVALLLICLRDDCCYRVRPVSLDESDNATAESPARHSRTVRARR